MRRECECDVDFRCPNHDLAAEGRQFRREWEASGASLGGGYELDDPKHPEWLDRLLESV